jgi:hypothetical protein
LALRGKIGWPAVGNVLELCMKSNGVLLLRLYEKTSAAGNRYFAGRMAQASVVMMLDKHTEGADPVWQVFVSEPRQAAPTAQQGDSGRNVHPIGAARSTARKTAPRRSAAPVPAGELDDDVSDIGA